MAKDDTEGASGLAAVDYQVGASVLLLTDSDEGRAEWMAAAASAGCRVSDAETISGGATRLLRQIAADAVLVDLTADPGEALDDLLTGLEAGVEAGSFGVALSAPAAMIDRLSHRTLASDIFHLVDPDARERAEAVRVTSKRHPARLNDVGKAQATVRLQQLSEEVGRIASVLAALSEDEVATSAIATAQGQGPEGGEERIDAAQIRTIIRARRLRENFFKGELFADPAWDMLLDLMAARLEKQKVAVSSLCIASAVPPTTALRWIKALCDRGLFVRLADAEDGRRVFIELSDSAATMLDAYLRSVKRLSPLVL
jgi:hypothetical protein